MKNRVVLLCALLALTSLVAFAADVTGKWASEAGWARADLRPLH